MAVNAANNLKSVEQNVLFSRLSFTPHAGMQEKRLLASSNQPIRGAVSQLGQAYAGRLRAHAKLEETS